MPKFISLLIMLAATLGACREEARDQAARGPEYATEVEGSIHSLSRQADNSYEYNRTRYDSVGSIPFDSSGILFVDHTLSRQDAGHLMRKGIGFVFNYAGYREERQKRFKVLLVMPRGLNSTRRHIMRVADYYNLDEYHAIKLMEAAYPLIASPSIFKVTTSEEILLSQDQVLNAGQVPILIYHESLIKKLASLIRPGTHFIISNSFAAAPAQYLHPTALFDLRSIAPAILRASAAPTLSGFYATFRELYAQSMIEHRQVATLMYVGNAVPSGEGRSVVAYYSAPRE